MRRTSMILIVSNGYGEDAVGNALAHEMMARGVGVTAYPLVGVGHEYGGVPLLDPRRSLPSGGFSLRGSVTQVFSDLRAGGWLLWRNQRETLRRHSGSYRAIVAIGDVFCLWMAARAGGTATFVATAKSERVEPHRWPERVVIRMRASVTYTRDRATAISLSNRGIQARYVGNPLMDTITNGGAQIKNPDRPTITLLPGSRGDAPNNLAILLRLCHEVGRARSVNVVCALARTVDDRSLREAAHRAGWRERDGSLERDGMRVSLTRAFGSAVNAADVVVGLAGTANEQAAGLGKPVVAFPVPGAQYTARFMRLQQRLLGDALVPTPDWQPAVLTVQRLLDDPADRARRGQIGRERMGEPGAVRVIAAAILNQE